MDTMPIFPPNIITVKQYINDATTIDISNAATGETIEIDFEANMENEEVINDNNTCKDNDIYSLVIIFYFLQ